VREVLLLLISAMSAAVGGMCSASVTQSCPVVAAVSQRHFDTATR
jgi:hypothetical protein